MFKHLFKNFNLKDVFEKHPEPIIIIDSQKKICEWNKAAINTFGYSKREAKDKNLNLIFTEYKDIIENKNIILKAQNKNGQTLYVDTICTKLSPSDKYMIAAKDVSEKQKQLAILFEEYENLKNINLNKSGFIADMSNNIKNPLHSIIGFSQALIDGLGGPLTEKQHKYVSIISKNANSLNALLTNIIDISKADADKIEYNLKHFDITQLIKVICETVLPIIEDKKLSFGVNLSELEKRNVFSDENILRQILLIILDNAIKFTDAGTIKFKISHPDLDFTKQQGIDIPEGFSDNSYLMISISDTGIGIPEAKLDSIFSEYRVIDQNIIKKYGGTGLSLALCYKLVKKLKGKIWVESEPEEGSSFNFIIPVDELPKD